MSRFYYEGYNWEGRKWQTVPAITRLGFEIETLVPERFPVDGTVASRLHDQNSPRSDHRPDSDGDVHAIDFGGETGWLAGTAEKLRLAGDPRIRYLIHNGRIFSNYSLNGVPPFTWRPYSGSSPHERHVHVSVDRTESLAGDDSPWGLMKEEDVFTDHEIKILKQVVTSLDEVESNGFFAGESVKLIREERGMPLHNVVADSEDEVARLGVEANAREITHIKETLRNV